MEKYWRKSACPYDCPDACGLLVETDDKHIYRVKGDPDHPVTKGFICRKMHDYAKTVHNSRRILQPMKRVGPKGEGRFEPITWDAAADIITTRWKALIQSHGAQCILPYSYAGVEHMIQNKCGEAFFNRLGALRLDRTICSKAKTAGFLQMYGMTPGIFVNDMVYSDHIIIWGSNVKATWLHALERIRAAKKAGSRVTLIETYRWPGSDGLADDIILTRPGSDGALALAMAHVLKKEGLINKPFMDAHVQGGDSFLYSLDKYTPQWAAGVTGVDAQVIRHLAVAYGKARSPLIVFGSGLSRHSNGAMTTRCIAALPALTGAFMHRGGGYLAHISSAAAFDKDMVCRPDLLKDDVPLINMNQLADALTAPAAPIKSLYVYNSNPLNIAPSQKQLLAGLGREDLFTVVHERFMTDTAKYADIVLPADTSVEHGDIVTPYGSLCVQATEPVIEPLGESKSNWDTFCFLAKAMGFTESLWDMSNEELRQQIIAKDSPWRSRWSAEERAAFENGSAVVLPLPGPLDFQTQSGKIELYNPRLEAPLPAYVPNLSLLEPGLSLVVAPSDRTLNSTFTDREDLTRERGPMTLKISPEDAKGENIVDGDMIEASNALASVCFLARVTPDVPRGTVVAEGVYSLDRSFNGLTVNALLSQRLTDAGDAATLCDNSVRLRKVASGG